MSAAGAVRDSSVFAELWRGLLMGSIAAGVAALPAAFRASHAAASLGGCWIALAGSTALLLAPAVGAFRAARPMPRAAATLLVGLLLATGPLVIFARLLKATTHYRPLGGATFAIVATGVLLGCFALSGRLVAASHSGSRRRVAQRLLVVLAAASALTGLALAAPAVGAGGLRAGIFDGALAVALGLAAALPSASGWLPAPRARLAGPVVWLVLVIAGAGVLHFTPAVRAACSARSPVLLGLPGWLG